MRLFSAVAHSRQLQRGYRLRGSHNFLFYFISFLMSWEGSLDVIVPVSHNRDDKTLIIMNNVATRGSQGVTTVIGIPPYLAWVSPHLGFLRPIMANNPGPGVRIQWVMVQFKCIE